MRGEMRGHQRGTSLQYSVYWVPNRSSSLGSSYSRTKVWNRPKKQAGIHQQDR